MRAVAILTPVETLKLRELESCLHYFLCPTGGRPTELYCSLRKTKLKTKLLQPKRATFKDLQDPILNEWESALAEAKARTAEEWYA
jgi:hypothetical protein